MTDTVKFIIEIPKEKELIDKAIWYDVSDFDTEDLAIILTALKNGVPLDDVKALEQELCEDCSRINNPNPYYDCISRQYLLDNCVVDKITMPYVPINKIENAPSVTPKLQMVQNPCVECGCNYCTNDDCENRYIVDIAESEDKE